MKRFLSLTLALVMIIAAFPVVVFSDSVATPTNTSVTTNHNQNDGVVMNKIATPRLGPDGQPDGTIDITVEAYTTGVVTSTTKVTSANIYLVLDTSGSMSDGATYETVYVYNPVYGTLFQERHWEGSWGSGQWVYTDVYGFESNNTLYIKNGEDYVSVRSAGTDDNGFEYFSYRSGYTTTYVYPVLDSEPTGVSRQYQYSVVQFYNRTTQQVQTSKSRMEMLAEGVDLFIAETLEANKSVANDADKHSIALIKFADDSYYSGSGSTQEVSKAVVGNNKQSNGYNYSQVVAPLTTVNETGAATLIAHMDSITPGGATSVDYGLALATQLINEASNSAADRKNVVVVFTDGEPNHSNGYDESVAATCINQAKALKDIGVTIFTICVDENADSSAALTTSNEDINKFMHYLSSNFPNATAGNNNVLDDGVANSEVAEAMGRGFYQTPDTNMSLGSIFEGIAQSIEKPTIEVGESATLVDTISPYFTLPEGTNGISVLTSEKTATGWADPVDVSSSVTVTLQNGRTISVNGFDFDENYVSETPRNGFYGKKLILTFNITPDYDALDTAADAVGEDGKIATNYGDATLYDSSMNAVATAPSPTLQMYKVTYYVDGVPYKTVYRFAGTDVTLIDEPADTAALDYGTWTSEDVTITDDQFKMPAEDVEIHLTSTRKNYKVTYRYSGAVPAEAPAAPAEQTYENGTTVQVEAPVSVPGYVFVGWNTVSAQVNDNGEFTMPAHDVEFIGYFTAGVVTYTVEHYLQNVDGTWPAEATTTHTHDGTTGETVYALTTIEYPNFTLDTTVPGTVLEGEVKSDGSLVLKLYYVREQYTVEYQYVGDYPAEAPALPETKTYYYGAEVVLAPVPSVPGYTFVGWATDGADVVLFDGTNGKYFTMPGRDVVIKGTFIANTGTEYAVEHYLEAENGEYVLEETTYHTGTTGAEANAVPGNYPSYSHYPNHPNTKESGTIEGDGSLVLRVYYNRDPYEVRYTITGENIPAGVVAPATKEYDWGTDVSVEDVFNIEGYVFYGWYTDDVTVNASGEFEMPAYDVEFIGYFAKETATYTVEHYVMDTEGNYPATPTESYDQTGDVGNEATASYATFNNVVPDTDHPNTKLTGKIVSNKNGDKLVLRLYYERIQSKVTYSYTSAPDSAPALPAEKTYYAGATVNVEATPTLEGYTFVGWMSADVSLTSGSFTMPNKDVLITGYFVANEGTHYTVEHYVEVREGVYELRLEATHTGVTDTTATATPENFHGYKFVEDHPSNVVSGTITGDGNLVLKLYYDRLSYKVSYSIVGDLIPEGVVVPETKEYEWGTTVSVEDVYNIEGYTFIGWDTEDVTVNGGEFTMPAEDVQFAGKFVIHTAIYTVEHYLQNADGTWPETASTSHTHEGQVGTTATALTNITYPNFTLDTTISGTVLEGEVKADGSLVLKLYYVRDKYTVSYEYIGTAPTGAPALPADADYYYNQEVTLAPVPTLAGYTFIGWATDGSDVIILEKGNDKYIVMPNRDVVIKGTFLANSGTEYRVEHYLEGEGGEYFLKETTTHTGTTGTEANAMPLSYTGYTHNPDHPEAKESGTIEGDGSLVLKVYYNKTPYKVIYSISGNVPDGATAPATETHDYTDTVTVKPYAEIAGYRFVGWTTTDVTVSDDGTFTMPAHDVYLSGYYVKTIAGYTVEHYLMDTEGNYHETPAESYSIMGNIGDTAEADYLLFEGFTPDRDQEGTLLSGEITAEGNLVLKLYYERNKYKVTYSYTSAPESAPALPAEAEYYYGETVNVAGIPSISGYTFYGWTTDDVEVSGDDFTMPAADVEFTGYFVAGPSKYTVEHYKQNIDGTYNDTPDDTEVFSAGVKVDDFVVAQFKTYEGFTPVTTGVYSGVVTPEPDTLVIKLYYTRNCYKVNYVYFGTQPEGAPALPAEAEYYYGETVTIAPTPVLDDYVFDGWNSLNANLGGETFTMPAHDVTLYGKFILVKATYRVEHYLQNTDGTWPETTSYFDIIKGSIGETAVATYKTFEGFTADEDHADTILEGMVDEAGTLVLKLYYERNKYKVSYEYTGTVPEDAPALPADEYVYHGVTVNVADEPESKYFEFNGWTSTDATISSGSFTMPAHDVVISGSFTQTNFPYRVNYYVDNNLYESFIVYSGDIHTIIEKPEYPAPITFKGWSEPINASTGKVVPTTDGKFVMPEADVNIYGERNVNMPIDGTVSIEKELETPAGFNVRYFTFSIYREYGTRLEYIKTVRIKAGEKISISLNPGIYQIVEEDAEVEGYTLFTTSDVEGNRVVVKAGRLSSIKFKNSYYENVLVREDHFGYVIGYPDGLVRPEANITRAEVATIFFRMLTDEARAKYWSQTNSFSDVSSSDWFNNAVSTLANAGVLNGYADGTFRPNAYITRAELVKIAVSFFGTSAGQSTHFADASNHWATEFVAAAEEFGFIDGYEDGTFRPDKYVTRAEAMKIINRTLGRNPHKNQLLPGMITWADNTADKWYYADVQEATNSHIYIWDDFGYEIWEAILPVCDWAALEKEWSTANAD